MVVYPNAAPSTLSDSHRRQLFEESGIDSGVAEERGYRTARSRSGTPEILKGYQRKPGLVVPTFSPDGITRSCQLRPDKPRKDKTGKPLKYETPGGARAILDVHPRMCEEVRSGTGDLWVTEGIKKADSLTSRDLPTIGLIGVWNFQRDGEMLPCWDHVNLERRAYVVYDNDVMVKEGVQLALQRLVRDLERRGAEVLVVYLPDGPLKGVDDFLAAGHSVAELKMLARKFEPADIGHIRLSRDQKLRAGVEDLERRWWDEEWKGRGGHTDRDLALKLIEAATRSGKIHTDGLRVKVSWGTLQVGVKVARKTLAKALARLEDRGFLYRDNEGRKVDKTGAFVLRARVDHYGEKATQATQELPVCDRGGLPLRAPRLRWSQPKFTPKRGTVAGTRRVRESKPLEARDRIERLGKIRGAIVDALEVAGGERTLQELCEALHRSRPRDVRRRILPMLEETGVIEREGDVIRLAKDWSERLDDVRAAGGEIEADERAEEARKRKSRAYHNRDKPLISKPSPAGLAAVERSREKRAEHIAEHDEHQAAARAADLEHKKFVKRFVHDRMRALGRIRLELLQEVLRDAGGKPSYALPAAKSLGCAVERLPEYENREFVFAPREWGEGAA
jgi:ribosomal protein S19E (S16A)